MSYYGIGSNRRGVFATCREGKETVEYKTWHQMLARCYDPRAVARCQAYEGCSVSIEFWEFQDFAAWAVHQTGFGLPHYALDKDLLGRGRKQYGRETAVFIPRALNNFLTDRKSLRGELPQGVRQEARECFSARLNIDGKQRHLGCFPTTEQAAAAYGRAKSAEARRWAARLRAGEFTADSRVITALEEFIFVQK